MTPGEEFLLAIRPHTALLDIQWPFFSTMLQPALYKARVHQDRANYDELTPEQKRARARDYFDKMVPVCTPLVVDPGPNLYPTHIEPQLEPRGGVSNLNGRQRHSPAEGAPMLPRLVSLPVQPLSVRQC